MHKSAKKPVDKWQLRQHRRQLLGASLFFTGASFLLAFFIKWPAYEWADGCLLAGVVLFLWKAYPLKTSGTEFVNTIFYRRSAHVGRSVLLYLCLLGLNAFVMSAILIYLNNTFPFALKPSEIPRSLLVIIVFFLPVWLFSLLGIAAWYILTGGIHAVRDILRQAQ